MKPFCMRCVRVVLASLLALSLAGGLSGPLGAETHSKKEKQQPKKYAAPNAEQGKATYPRPAPHVELNADRMPIGSTLWWEQMRREGRLGGETP